jgi:hypothetical protein
MNTFMGKPISYWMELDRIAEELNVATIIDQNARLRAENSYMRNLIVDATRYLDHTEASAAAILNWRTK